MQSKNGIIHFQQMESTSFYDAFASQYHEYALKRRPYLESVNHLIVDACKRLHSPRMLDVGTGNGERGAALAKAIGSSSFTLVDNSRKMVELASSLTVSDCRQVDVADRAATTALGEFDVILCLWNVLGHIYPASARLDALSNLHHILAPQGSLFIDLSNRYNLVHYGWQAILRNLRQELTAGAGDTRYQIELSDGAKLSAKSHFFSPREASKLFKRAGFRLFSRVVIDYSNGAERPRFWQGHLFFELRK